MTNPTVGQIIHIFHTPFYALRVFFDACDGFFTNYNWTETSLEAMAADNDIVRDRQADIYVGVDVFARGKVVGGMFDTNKVLI